MSSASHALALSALLAALTACTPNKQQEVVPITKPESFDVSDFKARGKINSQIMNLNLPEVTTETVQTQFLKVAKHLTEVMATCPERIWPNYSYKDIDVLLLSEVTEPQLWTAAKGLQKIDESKVPAEAKNFIYSKLEINGRKVVGIFVDKGSPWILLGNELFQLIVHEGFHFYAQTDWVRREGKRGTAYPLHSEPRYQRRMVYEEMFNYSQDPKKSQDRLGKAVHHHNQWTKGSPDEVLSTTDGYEGTARFVDALANILSERGCQAPDSELYAIHNGKISFDLGPYLDPRRLALDSEGYGIGAMTSFILHFENIAPNWHSLIRQGKTPTEILFENVPAVVAADNADLKKQYQEAVDTENSKIKALIQPTIDELKSTEMIRVTPPVSAMQGYSPIGHFLPSELPGITIIPLAMELPFRGSNWTMTLSKQSAVFSVVSSPCIMGWASFMVPANLLGADETKLEIKTEKINGSMPGELRMDSSGVQWFCGTL